MNTIDLQNNPMSDTRQILSSFQPITLEEMEHVKLLDRVDTKFTFKLEKLPLLLEQMKDDYRILEVCGTRICRYETRYFDTEDFKLYLNHHNGKLNRFKIRYRKYVDSDNTFFEIKIKNNQRRMIKKRVEVEEIGETILGEAEQLLMKKTDLPATLFHPTLNVYYSRMTFVNRNASERLTIDTGLHYDCPSGELSFPILVIVESKQERSAKSPLILLMRKHHIRELSISKYCLGISNLVDGIKKNNFKSKIIQLNKTDHGTN